MFPWGGQRGPALVGSWAEAPVPAIRPVGIVVTSPGSAQSTGIAQRVGENICVGLYIVGI